MPTTAATLLVTVAELRVHARNSVAQLDSDTPFAERCLRAAQDRVASRLGYEPFVHPVTQDAGAFEEGYHTAAYLGRAYYVGATDRPAVQVTTAGVTIGAGLWEGRLFWDTLTDGDPATIAYFAGFRRADQTLVNLQALTGLATLTVLPGEVPSDLFDVIVEAAVVIAQRKTSGTLGLASVEQDLGSSVTRITRAPAEALYDVLASIPARYRRLSV